jgi:phenylpyruvate tautomerase PptA (4-oxalocrotonate tautomerase family)
MPILEVMIVLRDAEQIPPGLASRIADAASSALGSAPGLTWVRLTALSRDQYAEDSGGPPEGVSPVFVSVLKSQVEGPEDLRVEAQNLAMALAGATSRPPENVHIIYEAQANGRIAFGGRLQT